MQLSAKEVPECLVVSKMMAMLRAPSAGHVSLKHPSEAVAGLGAGEHFGLLSPWRGTREVLTPKAPTPSSSLHIPGVAEILIVLLHD